MCRLKMILFIASISVANVCVAQVFTTPEVFSFKQEVFSPVSYYTGQANISIPITQIQTPEITIPVTLNYVGGGGLRAINPYSSAGMGWRISAGGAISRSKNGVCDETLSADGAILNGFFSLAPNSVTNSYVRNNVSSYVAFDVAGRQSFAPSTEYSPDVFSFSFLGYSGYFLMGYDGNFKIQSQEIVTVEKINNVSWPGAGLAIGFKLTANDGTKFTFGTTVGSMELSGGIAQTVPPYTQTPYQCDAWYLTKIESTNGRSITLSYQPNNNTFVRYSAISTGEQAANCPVVLDKIFFNGGTVVFNSSTVTQYVCGSASHPRLIDSIELRDPENKVVNKSIFTYSPYGSQRYYFLDVATINDKTYSFDYYNRAGLPNEQTALGMDYWGYYNGSTEVTSIGTGNVSSYWDYYLNPTVTYPARMGSLDYAKRGILTSITYPTGGAESYEYELNKYTYKGLTTLGGTYYNSSTPGDAGGLRIAKITLGNMVKKYKYVTNFDPAHPDAGTSSGILYRLPGVPYYGRSAVNAISIEGEPPIVYSKVIELLSDNSYTEYTMRSPLDKPDGDNTQNTSYYSVQASNAAIFSNCNKIGFVGSLGKNSSRSLERGQISSTKIYDGTNTLKKSVEYVYATDPNRYSQNVALANLTGTADQGLAQLGFEIGVRYLGASVTFSIIHSYEVYTFPVYLEKQTETTYENGNTLQQITEYQYNTEKLRSKIITTNSKGASIKTEIRYPKDVNIGLYATMVSKSMLSFPVEQIQFNGTNVTGAKLTTYKLNGTSYVADKRYSVETLAPFSGFTYFNGTTKDSRYGSVPEISYDSYDTYGNVRQTTGKDNVITSFLWDASGRYPMAQVKGATYSSISAQDGKAAKYLSSTLFANLTSLVPSAFINTYSYQPLVGILGTTDQRGRNSYYVYDQYSRLKFIKDHDNHVVKTYCYNYQGQPESCGFYGNQLLSQTKRKNNCSGCQVGSAVTYSVPADTYFAGSQTEANNLAQADINANAQNYANANGTCSTAGGSTFSAYNSITTRSFDFQLRNTCTNSTYGFTLNASASNVNFPGIPEGNYSVTITPNGSGAGTYNYLFNGAFQQGGTVTMTVDILSTLTGTNQIRVY